MAARGCLTSSKPRLSACSHNGGSSMTPLETIEFILKLVTLIGLISIAVGVVRRHVNGEDLLLYPALGFTAVSGALWIVVSMLLQR